GVPLTAGIYVHGESQGPVYTGHSHYRFSNEMIDRVRAVRSIGVRLPTVATERAPTMLPIAAMISAGASCAMHNDVMANTASPAPTRSAKWLARAGASTKPSSLL